jgi:hypothetical protein
MNPGEEPERRMMIEEPWDDEITLTKSFDMEDYEYDYDVILKKPKDNETEEDLVKIGNILRRSFSFEDRLFHIFRFLLEFYAKIVKHGKL